MKKFFAIAAFAAIVFAGCDKKSNDDGFDGWVGVPEIKVTPAETTIGVEGDEVTVSVESEAPWVVEIPQTAPDVTADILEGQGAGMVTFTVGAYDGVSRQINILFRASGYNNGMLEERTAELVINQTDGGTVVNDDLIEYDDHIVYHGVSYRVAKLADGNVWMVDNLRYVPDGVTVASDPTVAAGVWYPYTSDGTTITAVTDEEGVASRGLLYDAATLFGTEITADNIYSFEGAQGLCPEGWHVPTFAEGLALVGKCSKLNYAVAGYEVGDTPSDTQAFFYDADYDGANIAAMNSAGFNFAFAGTRNGASSGSYTKPLAGYLDKPMTYLWLSTGYKPVSTFQLFSLGSTSTASYPDGRLTVMFNNHYNGSPVRCVKNK